MSKLLLLSGGIFVLIVAFGALIVCFNRHKVGQDSYFLPDEPIKDFACRFSKVRFEGISEQDLWIHGYEAFACLLPTKLEDKCYLQLFFFRTDKTLNSPKPCRLEMTGFDPNNPNMVRPFGIDNMTCSSNVESTSFGVLLDMGRESSCVRTDGIMLRSEVVGTVKIPMK